MADEPVVAVAEAPVVEAPVVDADIAEHMRLDDPHGLAPRSVTNFILTELHKMRDAILGPHRNDEVSK